jgi:hypothetical protein
MLEDVAGDVGFIDARVLVRLEVLQGILGDAFMLRKICHLSVTILRARGARAREFAPLLGGILGLVAGGGSDISVVGTADYIGMYATSSHADAGDLTAKATLAVESCSHRGRQVSMGPAASNAMQGSIVAPRVIGAAPAVLAREYPQ